jgi:glycosyltransferase involved in cell wall biosynthesis
MLNFLPLSTGGGVQVALDFLQQAKSHGGAHEWLLVTRENSQFSKLVFSENIRIVHQVPDNIKDRLMFEYFGCKKIVKEHAPDLIYTQFGPIWPGANIINISGCAYSNLFYPELNFWGALPWNKRLVKKIIDWQRLKRLLMSDVCIFETEDLAIRAAQQHNLSPERVTYVRAAVSSLVTKDSSHIETQKRCEELPEGTKVLLLSGYHPNKNIELLVKAAAILKKKGRADIAFVLTLPEEKKEVKILFESIRQQGLQNWVYNFGPVPQEGCSELYRACDYSILPSTLESFSNMIAETWAMDRPLLISELSWCRSLCGEGAIYFDYLNPASIVEKIESMVDGGIDVDAIVAAGAQQLATYPSPEGRFKNYLSIIETNSGQVKV